MMIKLLVLLRAQFASQYYAVQALLNGKLLLGNQLADFGYESFKYESC